MGVVALVLLALVPPNTSAYVTDLIVLMCIWATINVSWNLVLGYGGIFTFGQMAFFAIGGYTAGLMNLHWHLSPLLTTTCGAVAAGIAGGLIGLPSLRLYGPYMVLFTLAFQMMLYTLLVTDTSGFFGGSFGLLGIDGYTIPGISSDYAPYYVATAMLVGSAIVVTLIVRSPIGIGVRALRDSRASARARGVHLVQHRMIIFMVSAALTGLAGAFYAHYYSIITPTTLEVGLLVNLLAMIIVGGVGSTYGVIAGTVALVYLNDWLATQQQYSAVLWGCIIIVTVLVLPGGIAGAARSVVELVMRLAFRPARPTAEGAASHVDARRLFRSIAPRRWDR
jgi:branched-chain amino acid transport system permease protein